MFKTLIFSTACILGLLCSSVSAQKTSKRVSVQADWSIFVESEPMECWAVSAPIETVNKRGGSIVKVRRSAIYLSVFYRPKDNIKGEVSFTGGYTFANGRSIALDIGNVTYELATDGEWAWPLTPAVDAKIIAAMKSGAKAVITAQSERGTITKDTFSLKGFTAALKDAEKRCIG